MVAKWGLKNLCKCSHPRQAHNIESPTITSPQRIHIKHKHVTNALKRDNRDTTSPCLTGLVCTRRRKVGGKFVVEEFTPYPSSTMDGICQCSEFVDAMEMNW